MAKRQNNRPWKAQAQEQRNILAVANRLEALSQGLRDRLWALTGTSKRAVHRVASQIERFDERWRVKL